jgi:DNA-binding beta-propeller fold protein YncE
VTTVVSPDKTTLLVLTSGYNKVFWVDTMQNPSVVAGSAEYVFVYDISTGAPAKKQVLPIQVKVDEKHALTNTYSGIAFDPSGRAFYVSGGSDDVVHVFARNALGAWGAHPDQPLIALGHGGRGVGIPPFDVPSNTPEDPIAKVNSLITVKPCAAGLALSKDGQTMVVVNYYNDSVSIFRGGPDYYRFREWERDFDALYGDGPSSEGRPFPALTLVRFMEDHTGSFLTALDKVTSPEIQVADNDWALGLLVEKISKSRHADDTLIFVVEDDAQDGGDHVDSHRSAPFVIGAYVKRGAVASTQHNTIDFIRTIEEVLGIPPMNLNDALARPMADIFERTPQPWTFKAVPSPYLCDLAYRSTELDLCTIRKEPPER